MTAHRAEAIMKDGTRIALLEQSITHINDTMLRIEKRFDAVDARFDRIELRIDALSGEMKQGFKDINNRLWSNFFWMVGGFAGILGLVAHAVHWF